MITVHLQPCAFSPRQDVIFKVGFGVRHLGLTLSQLKLRTNIKNQWEKPSVGLAQEVLFFNATNSIFLIYDSKYNIRQGRWILYKFML